MKPLIASIYDPFFKTLMTSKEHKDFILLLLENITQKKISDIVISTQVLPIENKESKQSITDVLYQVEEYFYINLEANSTNTSTLQIKNESYLCKLFGELFSRGKAYKNAKIIQINFNYFDKGQDIVNKYQMMDVVSHEVENEFLEKYHINLTKLLAKSKKVCYNDINNKLTLIERALLLLVETNPKRLEALASGVIALEKVVRRIKQMNRDEFMIGLYDPEEDRRSFIEGIKFEFEEKGLEKGLEKGKVYGRKEGIKIGKMQGLAEGKLKGIEIGLKEGKKEGIEEGIKKGIKEGIKEGLYVSAKNLLKENVDFSLIQKATNLSLEEIQSLQSRV